MNKKIIFADSKNKKMEWLSTSWLRIAIMPIIDIIVLLLVFSTILFVLNEYNIANLYLGGSVLATYIYVVLGYVAISIIIAIFDLFKYRKFNNTFIVRENNNIIFIKSYKNPKGSSRTVIGSLLLGNSSSLLQSLAAIGIYSSGAIAMQNDMSDHDREIVNEINKILEERPTGYKYTEYKNYKFVRQTKNFYEFNGEKNGVSSSFKIYKVYSNIDFIIKEEN